jgi:signal transduction histidine kinase
MTASVAILVGLELVTIIAVVQGSIMDQRWIQQADLGPALHLEARALATGLRPLLEPARRAGPSAEKWLSSRRGLCDLGVEAEVTTAEGTLERVLVVLSRLVVADQEGRILAAYPEEEESRGRSLLATTPAVAHPLIQAATDGRTEPSDFAHRVPGGSTFATAPVLAGDGAVLGLVYIEAGTGPLDVENLGRRLLRITTQRLPQAAPFAVVIALILGALSTRGLIGRLRRLGRASAAWSRGDLARRVGDASGDELGELAQDLDNMAMRLGTLLDAREELAALEERNHLARELHDTVKQKLFSVSMLLGSVELLLESDPSRARTCLADARGAAQQASRELVTLIDQLRPESREHGDLAAAVRDYVANWSRQEGIQAHVVASNGQDLSDDVQRNLLLVAQEALANVARHSRARRVEVKLVDDAALTRLSVRDDGVGFDVDAAPRGGFGLESMISRMDGLGGRLEVTSARGQGTTVVAEYAAPRDKGASEVGQVA